MKEVITVSKVRAYFSNNHSHIDIFSLDNKTIEEFLAQDYVISLPFSRQMDCLYDYIVSQDMCDVQE